MTDAVGTQDATVAYATVKQEPAVVRYFAIRQTAPGGLAVIGKL